MDCTESYQPTNKAVLACIVCQIMAGISRISGLKLTPGCRSVELERNCRNAESKGLLTFSTKAESTFTSMGFNNWKKALTFYGYI